MEKYQAEIPDFTPPIKGIDNRTYLEFLVYEGATRRYGEPYSEEVSERIRCELDMIFKKRTTNYFLIVYEIVKVARDVFGALIGPGRGSASGSIVNYCLGITQIDPMKYGLLFERFFYPIRTSLLLPVAISIDIDTESRQKLIDWIENRYGECFAYIATYPEKSIDTYRIALSRQPISSLTETISLKNDLGKDVICAVAKSFCIEDQGIIELQIHKSDTLSRLKMTGIDWRHIPLNDAKTINLFKEGKTSRIFQFSSTGMKKILKTFKPDNFQELVLLNALYKSASIDYIPTLLFNKQNPDAVKYPIDSMSGILDETYGVIIYQEQVMNIAQKIANFTKEESYKFLKVLQKRTIRKFPTFKRKFVAGGIKNGYDKNTLNECWKMMEHRSFWAFPKSHDVAYTLISYLCAYCKVHHTSEFNKSFKNYIQ